MANSVNKGNQRQRIQYGQRITAFQENQGFYQIIPTGVYSGMMLSVVAGNIEVSMGTCFIADTNNEVSLRVQTLSSWTITSITEARPYIVLTYDWVDSANNYMDFVAKAIGEITAKDIVLGMGVYIGSVLQSTIDYTLRKISPLVLISSLNDIMTVQSSVIITGNLEVQGTTVTFNTTQLEIEDNLMLLNKGMTGVPPTSLKGGLEIERGDSTNQQLVFDELDDEWKAGEVGDLKTIVREGDTLAISGLITGSGIVNSSGGVSIVTSLTTGIQLMSFNTTLNEVTFSAKVYATEFIEV